MAVVFLYQITVFYNKTQHHVWNFILLIQFNANCVHAVAAAVNKEVADGADVVFTDTGC